MSVAVQDGVDPGRHAAGRYMNEMENQAFAFEREYFGPGGMVIAIAHDHTQRRPELFKLDQCLRRTDVAQVPDLIGVGQPAGQRGRIAVVRVGNNGNTHAERRWRISASETMQKVAETRLGLGAWPTLASLEAGSHDRAEGTASF